MRLKLNLSCDVVAQRLRSPGGPSGLRKSGWCFDGVDMSRFVVGAKRRHRDIRAYQITRAKAMLDELELTNAWWGFKEHTVVMSPSTSLARQCEGRCR